MSEHVSSEIEFEFYVQISEEALAEIRTRTDALLTQYGVIGHDKDAEGTYTSLLVSRPKASTIAFFRDDLTREIAVLERV